MKKKNIIGWVIGIAVVGILIIVSLAKQNKQPETIKIGAILLLSGENALWGENAQKAINLLVEETNLRGGINGKKVKILYEDSKGDPKIAVAAFNKLTNIEHVPAILGDMLSVTTLAMSPSANKSKVVLMGISCSAPSITEAGPFVYRVWPSDLYEGKVFAEWVYKKGFKDIAIVYINNDYGNGLKEAFSKRFIELGGRITIAEGYTSAQQDFRPIIIKLKQSKPQGVYIVGYYEDTAQFIKEAKQQGLSSQLFGTSSSVHSKLFDIAGQASEGFIVAMVNDFDVNNLTPKQKEFLEKYRNLYKQDPDWAATHAADAFLVIKQCLEKGCKTGEEIKRCIDNQRTFDGINIGVTFDDNGDVINKPIVIKKVENGRFIDIETIK